LDRIIASEVTPMTDSNQPTAPDERCPICGNAIRSGQRVRVIIPPKLDKSISVATFNDRDYTDPNDADTWIRATWCLSGPRRGKSQGIVRIHIPINKPRYIEMKTPGTPAYNSYVELMAQALAKEMRADYGEHLEGLRGTTAQQRRWWKANRPGREWPGDK
jgi:hypothetical protein